MRTGELASGSRGPVQGGRARALAAAYPAQPGRFVRRPRLPARSARHILDNPPQEKQPTTR